jgi:hypothetical protein
MALLGVARAAAWLSGVAAARLRGGARGTAGCAAYGAAPRGGLDGAARRGRGHGRSSRASQGGENDGRGGGRRRVGRRERENERERKREQRGRRPAVLKT